ncbi:MAG TPA: RsmE family RNA methyltransferase [Gemmatimonadales bacterium]|nr:RsmE family RNA methyltransferase [Gemmatimonadales bacterium]
MGGRGGETMLTVLVPPGPRQAGEQVSLPPGEVHHLKVRRARAGDRLRLVNGEGLLASGVLADPVRDGQVVLDQVSVVPRPSPLQLAVGAGDRDRFAWLVEKAAELGVTDVIPLETERTRGVSSRVRGEHVEKLQRRAFEATKQCGAAWSPMVHLPHTIPEVVTRHRGEILWLADVDGAVAGPVPATASVLVAVGPEGGFTEAERQLLMDAGFQPTRLGPHTLRFETAAIAAAVTGVAQRTEVSSE